VTNIRVAAKADLPAIVELLVDDPLGRSRESGAAADMPWYAAAFDAIAADPNNEVLVIDDAGTIVAVAQVTYAPGLSRRGAWRATIESVRVHRERRRQGLGKQLIDACITRARARHCRIVQLTTDHRRREAQAFYEALGFTHTHAGMKRELFGARR
jgi:ribosomal protein S18 acetylase RimI-like enzyme